MCFPSPTLASAQEEITLKQQINCKDMKKVLIVIMASLAFCGVISARKVTGSVVSGDQKLTGVIVTDGVNFTQTKKNGKFSFNIQDDAQFVYIVTPAGYVADYSSGVPAFYQAAEGKKNFVFDLQKTKGGDDYTIVAIADPQFRNDSQFEKFASYPLDDLSEHTKTLAKDNLTVGVALGDICWDVMSLLDDYKREIVRTGIPFYPVVGNHDHNQHNKGDKETVSDYNKAMGPQNYAFYLGKDLVICVDDIIYDTKKKYEEGYAPDVLAWVEGLMEYVPAEADLYICQHSPLHFKFKRNGRKWAENAKEMFDIVRGHKVTFLSGHTHVSNYYEYEENITEHNVAGFCGAWWDTEYCTDGTPSGFKVFNMKDDNLSWYYKSRRRDKDYQVEIYKPGQTVHHPNSVVANIWDWDPTWKVEWYEDGVAKGPMTQICTYSPMFINEIYDVFHNKGRNTPSYKKPTLNDHYFAATPSQYAKKVSISVESRFGQKWFFDVDMSDYIDVQAHRGGAGLHPENTIEAMKHALDMGVNTLELDLQLTGDGQVIVSHDSYFHHRYAIRPDGSPVLKDEPKEYLYTMPYDSILKYDVGSRQSEVWPQKACYPAVKPLAKDLIQFVEQYTKEMGYSPVRYNIEVKSSAKSGEGTNWANYDALADACCKLLISLNLGDRLVVQCFDHRALNHMHEKYPELIYSYLISAKNPGYDAYMAKLNFIPQWLSPHHSITDEELVRRCHEDGMKIVPWTADEPEDIKRLIDLKVDAIITNYQDRLLRQTRGHAYPIPADVK